MSGAPSLGIDFGTTNSSMAWLDDQGEAEILLNAEGEDKTPSVVFFGEREVLVGRAALNLLEDEGDDPEVGQRTVQSIKRNLVHPPVLSLPGGRDVRPVEVVAAILGKLKRDAEAGYFHEPVKRVVITHPTELDEVQKQVLRQAASLAGFEEVKLLPEPVAAALAFSRMGRKVGDAILVYDLGGGTLDLAVVTRQQDGSFDVPIPPDGDPRCGGDDFDQALYDLCDRLARDQLGRSLYLDGGRLDRRFLLDCRRRKENLSLQERATFSSYVDGVRFKHTLERAPFEAAIRPRVEGTVRKTERMAEQARSQGIALDSIVLVGGSSRIPIIRSEIERSLPVALLDWGPKDVAVALGAAYGTGRAPAPPSLPVPVPKVEILPPPPPPVQVLTPVVLHRNGTHLDAGEIRAVLERFMPQADLFVTPSIPPLKLQNASRSCGVPLSETVVGLLDATIFGSAKNAMLFGLEGIYYRNDFTALCSGPGAVAYADFPFIEFTPNSALEELGLGGDRSFQTVGSEVKKDRLAQILNAFKALIAARGGG
jgi:actin-like ATPase involved in cell morphogenesis